MRITNPSFAYDSNGNLESGPGRTVDWTSFNKVLKIRQTLPTSNTVTNVYDAEHQRVKQTSGGNTVRR